MCYSELWCVHPSVLYNNVNNMIIMITCSKMSLGWLDSDTNGCSLYVWFPMVAIYKKYNGTKVKAITFIAVLSTIDDAEYCPAIGI